ncbi:hypothetical protein BpHYR1_016267 [Brachionus plicatilis]|uniref:Uncharacterized protein n=1 Tax=Brachionus plicatilis TaxID=10195 RepID=A0A3M7RKL5_BRAPC|nr:hypothetical protein BpHYR1_016267 [Brachionus plicatilis]
MLVEHTLVEQLNNSLFELKHSLKGCTFKHPVVAQNSALFVISWIKMEFASEIITNSNPWACNFLINCFIESSMKISCIQLTICSC